MAKPTSVTTPNSDEQFSPKHRWDPAAAAVDAEIRALGFITLVDPEEAGYWCWGVGQLPRVFHLRMLANGRQLGNQMGFDLLAEAGMKLDSGGYGDESVQTKR